MADLVVIVPSRGRPEALREVAEAFRQTCTADTVLVGACDNDDPKLPEYANSAKVLACPSRTMVEALNQAAVPAATGWGYDDPRYSDHTPPFAIGFMGDDHRPRMKGWDAAYLAVLRELGTGIVYGNDLLQGENLPTQCAMTADVVRTLGYMAPAGLRHMYVDNFWRDLGQGADCLRYLPDVVVEHMHPVAGKAEWTEGHRRVNAQHVYERDAAEYGRFTRHELPAAVAKVRALRGSNG